MHRTSFRSLLLCTRTVQWSAHNRHAKIRKRNIRKLCTQNNWMPLSKTNWQSKRTYAYSRYFLWESNEFPKTLINSGRTFFHRHPVCRGTDFSDRKGPNMIRFDCNRNRLNNTVSMKTIQIHTENCNPMDDNEMRRTTFGIATNWCRITSMRYSIPTTPVPTVFTIFLHLFIP